MSPGGRLPDRWPRDFPLPPDSVAVADDSDAVALRLRFRSAEPGDLRRFFERALPDTGWDIEDVTDGDAELELEISGHGFYGQVELDDRDAESFWVQLVW